MNYTPQQLGFILYNNRSVDGVVKNFIDESINPNKLIDIEKKFDWCKSLYQKTEKMVEVDLSLLKSNSEDEIIMPEQLSRLSNFVTFNIGKFNESELKFLKNRGIGENTINSYNILGLSNFKNIDDLKAIGATCHPVLNEFLQDGISEGGIVIPLFKERNLINCSIRRISDVGKLKYTLAVPDLPVWGLSDIGERENIWICEGLFDMFALKSQGLKAVSPSSAMWSGIQLYQLLEKKPQSITIFCDNDRVGLQTGITLSKFFTLYKIDSKTVHSKMCKDASEHFFEKNLNIDDVEIIEITRKMIEEKNDNSFDFLKYLQKRKF